MGSLQGYTARLCALLTIQPQSELRYLQLERGPPQQEASIVRWCRCNELAQAAVKSLSQRLAGLEMQHNADLTLSAERELGSEINSYEPMIGNMPSRRQHAADWAGVGLELRRDIHAVNPRGRARTKPSEDCTAGEELAPDVLQRGELTLPGGGCAIGLTLPLSTAKAIQ